MSTASIDLSEGVAPSGITVVAYVRVVGGAAVTAATLAPTTGSSGQTLYYGTFTTSPSTSYVYSCIGSDGNTYATGDFQTDDNGNEITLGSISGESSGSGAYPLTINFKDSATSANIPGVTARISGAQSASPAVTDTNGNTIVALNSGTVLVTATAPGYGGYAQSQTVGTGTWATGGTTTLSLTLVEAGGSLSPGAGQTTAYLTVRDGQGNPVTSGIEFDFQLVNPTSTVDSFNTTTFNATSDDTGLLQVLLQQSTEYQARVTNAPASAPWTVFTTGSASTYPLPKVLGTYPG